MLVMISRAYLSAGILLILALPRISAADTLEIPAAPDPIGLGERLAMIDYVKEHGGTVPANLPLEDVRELYRRAWMRAPENNAVVTAHLEQAASRERVEALRRLIADKYGVAANIDATEDELSALNRQLADEKAAKDAKHIEQLAAADRARQAAAPPLVAEAPAERSESRKQPESEAILPPPPASASTATKTTAQASTPRNPKKELEDRKFRFGGSSGSCTLYWTDAGNKDPQNRTVRLCAANTDSVAHTLTGYALSPERNGREAKRSFSLYVPANGISSEWSVYIGMSSAPSITIEGMQ